MYSGVLLINPLYDWASFAGAKLDRKRQCAKKVSTKQVQSVEFIETAFKQHCQAESSLSASVQFALQYVNIFLCKYNLIHKV